MFFNDEEAILSLSEKGFTYVFVKVTIRDFFLGGFCQSEEDCLLSVLGE